MIRPLPRSTAGLVGLIAVLLVGITVVLGFLAYTVSHEALENQLDHRVDVETQGLLTLHAEGGSTALAAALRQRESHDGMGYILVDRDGRRLAGMLRAATPSPGRLELLASIGPDGEEVVSQALTTRLSDGGRLVVAADRAPIASADRDIVRVFSAALAAMLAAGVGSAWLVGVVIRRRIARINATAQSIIDGELSARMPRDPGSREFDELAATLNRMLDRIGELLDNLQQVSSDIAHDMRTPLARLRNVLDGAMQQDLDAEEAQAALARASAHAADLLELFTALLRISEIETFQVRSAFSRRNLSELVERCVDALRPDVEAAGYRLETVIQPEVFVEGDGRLLSQVVVNLIENAARHTPVGSSIVVSLSAARAEAMLAIADDGPGIPEDRRAFVLRRFSRLEQSRSTAGHGLGLSLASAIARAHHAELALEDNRPGLRVTLILKRS